MTGLRKLTTAAVCATTVGLAMSTAVLACDRSGDRASTTGSSCQATGNQLITDLHFTNNGSTVTNLRGHVAAGKNVTATFTVPASCSVEASLVSYQAPSGSFDSKTANQQAVFDSQDQTLGAGTHSLTVKVPSCYFQVDFVRGAPIAHLGPEGSNNFYSAQGRLISADNGGSHACASTPTTGGPTCASSSPELSNVSYLLGGTTTVANLRDHVSSGETVKVTFTVPANCSMQLSLAAYEAPLPHFTQASAPQQKLVDSQTGTFTGGVHSMQVTVPSCMFQVDFVHGAVLTTIGSTASTEYGPRIISADNGGEKSCSAVSNSTPTPTPVPTPTPTPVTTSSPTPVSTPTPSPTGTPTGTAAAVLPVTNGGPPASGVLGTSTDTPATGAHVGVTMAIAAVVVLLGFILLGLSGLLRRDEVI